jgi:ATP-binding cassette, subfamily B, bacterial
VIDKTIVQFFRIYTSERKLVILYAVVFSMMHSLLLLPSVYFIKEIFDSNIPMHDVQGLIINSAFVTGLTLIQSFLTIVHRNIFLRIVKGAVSLFQRDILRSLIWADRKFYDDSDQAKIVNRTVMDVENTDRMLNDILSVVIPQSTLFSIALLIMIIYNPIIGISTLVMGFLGTTMQKRMRKRVLKSIRIYNEAKDDLAAYVNFLPSKQVITKMRNNERGELAESVTLSDDLINKGTRAGWLGWQTRGTDDAVMNVSALALILIGAIQIVSGAASYGNIFGLYFLVIFMKRTVSSVQFSWSMVQEGIVSLERIFDMLDKARVEHEKGSDTSPAFQGNLQMTNVSFGYAKGKPVLTEIDFEIKKGEIINIIGSNGAGKTSLIDLLLGFYRPWSGDIFAEGVSYSQINPGELRFSIGYVPQAQVLLKGTIESNLGYGLISGEKIALAKFRETPIYQQLMAGFIDGQNTVVGPNGNNLSHGQIQRISILRALVFKPKLLILDEPTNHLDIQSIMTLVQELKTRMEMGVLIISHHALFQEIANRTYILDEGKLRPLPAP